MRIGTAVPLRNGREECKCAWRLRESIPKDFDDCNFFRCLIKILLHDAKNFLEHISQVSRGSVMAGFLTLFLCARIFFC